MLQVNQTINNRYTLSEFIAEGGMGEVWKAKDTRLDRYIALKILKSELAENPEFLKKFRDEAKHTAKLSNEYIARIFDYGEGIIEKTNQKIVFLAIELINGLTLSDILEENGPLELAKTLNILEQVAKGLAAAHNENIIHKDIKPANIVIENDKAKITDFGIAQVSTETTKSFNEKVFGTADYISPEQSRGEILTPSTDIYSLGVVGYEALSGKTPFHDEDPRVTALKKIQDSLPSLPKSIPSSVKKLIEKSLNKDSTSRFQNGSEFADAIKDVKQKLIDDNIISPESLTLGSEENNGNRRFSFSEFTKGWSRLQKYLLIISSVLGILAILCIGFFISISGSNQNKKVRETPKTSISSLKKSTTRSSTTEETTETFETTVEPIPETTTEETTPTETEETTEKSTTRSSTTKSSTTEETTPTETEETTEEDTEETTDEEEYIEPDNGFEEYE